MLALATSASASSILIHHVEVPHARPIGESRAASRLVDPEWPATSPFAAADLRPLDASPDRLFYLLPRFVQHVDDAARRSLQRYYTALFATAEADAPILDLCSSWTSHFPENLAPERRVVAVGMNPLELGKNPSATEWRVQNLNDDPTLPYEDNSFAFVTCALSIDYMTKPLALLAEVARVLRPGGVCALSFSNRMFPTKAVAHWVDRRKSAAAVLSEDRGPSDNYHVWAVGAYLHFAGGFGPPACADVTIGARTDPMFVVQAVVDK